MSQANDGTSTFVLDAREMLAEFDRWAEHADHFAAIAPTDEQRHRAEGAAEILRALRASIAERMVAATETELKT